MTEAEEADLRLRAETAESLLAAEREENERLRAELAVALGQKPERKSDDTDDLITELFKDVAEQYEKQKAERADRMYYEERVFLGDPIAIRRPMVRLAPMPKVSVDNNFERNALEVRLYRADKYFMFLVPRASVVEINRNSAIILDETRRAMCYLYDGAEPPASVEETREVASEVIRKLRSAARLRGEEP